MNDLMELGEALYTVGKSLVLLLYVYLTMFFFVHLFGSPVMFSRAAAGAVHELDRISAIAKRKSEA